MTHRLPFSRPARPGRLLAALLLLVLTLPAQAIIARAAGLAEPHTVLYYLIEMQRRSKKTCDGSMMPEAPSLIPLASLREAARAASASGRPAASTDGSPMLTAFTTGSTPQQAVNNLLARQCRDLMSPELRYIGAYGEGGNWTVVMAAADPERWIPAVPGQNQDPPPDAASPEKSSVPGAAEPAVQERSKNGEPIAPASPVVVGSMELDAAGRPVGPLLLLPPGGAAVPPAPGDTAFPAAAPAGQGSSGPARPGVTPLHDVRANAPSGGDFVFTAPAGNGAPAGAGGSSVSPAPAPAAPVRAPAPVPVGTPGLAPPSLPAPDLTVTLPQAPVTPAPRQGPSTMPVRAPASSAGADSTALLGLVNAVRARGTACGGSSLPAAPALAENAVLAASAQAHAADMAGRGYFSSTTPDSLTLGGRLTRAGYNWGFLAENIAKGSSSAERTLQSWLADEDQCRNIMNPQYRQAGTGFDASGRIWVFTLAAPMDGKGSR